MAGLLDALQGAGIDTILKTAGLKDDQIKIVKKVQDVITKDLGLSTDLKADIKKLINKDITVDKVLPLLKKCVANPNKTFDEVVAFIKTLK